MMHAGHITLNETTDTNLFFWRFQKQGTNFNRTVIWLNGGPGCSSMDGAMMESGPLRVNDEGQLVYNTGSWYEAADMVFVDQPGGTGFSTTNDYDKELTDVATEFIVFLLEYFKDFPEDASNDIYIAGESYAGQYIPFIADAILRSNEAQITNISLKGLIIGNGWIDPNVQSMSYIPYLMDSGILHTDDPFMSSLLTEQEKCQKEISDGSGKDKFSLADCENILTRILSYTRDKTKPKNEQCINMYDTRLRDSYPSCGMNWPPDLVNVQPWLQRDEVVEALNLKVSELTKWRECDGKVSSALKNRNSKPSIQFLPNLLSNMEIMLFNGDKDIICNNYGVLDMISKMEWAGSKGFEDDTEEFDWRYNGLSTGYIKSSRNLTFVSVFESSHMVPFDKSEDSRGLLDIFFGNFKMVDNGNETYVETPIYRGDSLIWLSDDDKTPENNGNDSTTNPAQNGGKSATPFILYLIFIVIVGALIFYFKGDKAPNSNSILKTSNKKNNVTKKTVSWADENSGESAQDYAKGGKFGEFFNNYSAQKKGYKKFGEGDNDEYEEIELQQQRDDASFDLDRELEDDRLSGN